MNTEMQIKFVPKDKIWPLFGYYDHSTDTIFIMEGLSKPETASLLVHEWRHSFNKPDEGFWRKESKSILSSIFDPLIGTIMIIFKSLFSWTRLKTYLERVKKDK
jgi:hypothetical protein